MKTGWIDPDNLGPEVARKRKEHGWTQRELARRTGTSHSTLIAIEQGRTTPRLNTYLRLCHELTTVAELQAVINDLERQNRDLREQLEVSTNADTT